MKLQFKERFLSWFDSYDIYDEDGRTVYVVKGQLSWGHCFKIFDARGREVGKVKEQIVTLRPKFDLYVDDKRIGCISKDFFNFLRPKYNIDFNGWHIEGSILEWDYAIYSGREKVATAEKRLLRFTDTYEINVKNPQDALFALMVVLAIDAEKCSEESDD